MQSLKVNFMSQQQTCR